jgi:hypothetical protein
LPQLDAFAIPFDIGHLRLHVLSNSHFDLSLVMMVTKLAFEVDALPTCSLEVETFVKKHVILKM